MAASVLFACGLNEAKLPSFVHISEESSVEGSFLISAILGQRLRISNAGVLLICLQHNYQHYFNAGMRLGYNANIFLGKTLSVIDPLTDIARNCFTSKWLVDERQVAANLLTEIREQMTVNLQNRGSVTILIDNLSALRNLGATNEDVIQLCHEVNALKDMHRNLAIITKMNNCDVFQTTDNNVTKLSDVRIRVEPLRSGIFREVDGKLIIERLTAITTTANETDDSKEDVGTFPAATTRKEVLFKINDRNIKIFSPGEVGLKA